MVFRAKNVFLNLNHLLGNAEETARRMAQLSARLTDTRAAAANADFCEVVTSAVTMDAGLLSAAATAFAVLLLALRRLLFV